MEHDRTVAFQTFDEQGRQPATSDTAGGRWVQLWPLVRPFPRVLRGHESEVRWLEFTPDGERLISTSEDGSVRVWPLAGTSGERSWVLDQAEGTFALAWRLAMAPDASFVVAGNSYGQVKDLPLDGGSICDLSGFTDGIRPIAIGPQSRLVAAGSGGGKIAVSPDGQRVASGGEGNSIRLWPMPDLSRPPLHTLPRSELIAKLKTLTNLRVVR